MTASKVRDFLLVASGGDCTMPMSRMLVLLEVAAVPKPWSGAVPWISQALISERLGLPHATVSRHGTALVAAGLVFKGLSKKDRRVAHLRITTKGRALMARASKAAA